MGKSLFDAVVRYLNSHSRKCQRRRTFPNVGTSVILAVISGVWEERRTKADASMGPEFDIWGGAACATGSRATFAIPSQAAAATSAWPADARRSADRPHHARYA